jgi:FkbM family methyltransferase
MGKAKNWDSKVGHINVPSVIDVGVAEGTPELYNTFNRANLLLIDPLLESKGKAKKILGNRSFIFEGAAVGSSPSTMKINVNSKLRESSLLNRASPSKIVEERTIEVNTLDNIVNKHKKKFPGPYLLKIDTEGFEFEVLKGATTTLRECKYVIAETSVVKRFEESYIFEDIIMFMYKNNFRVESILSSGGGFRIVDILFVNKDLVNESVTNR